MAKKNFFAIIAMVAVLFTGCEKDMLVENSNQYASDKVGKQIEPVNPKEEKIVDIIDKDKTERFVNGGVEYSFIPVLIDQDGGEHPLTRMSTVWPFTAKGTDPQIFDGIKTHEYTTISGEFRSSSSEDPGGVWTARIRKSTQPYTAQNKSESHSFNHQVEAEVAEMVCTYEYEGLKREFVFPAPEIVISGKQLPNQKAANVPYNGKVFEADQYTWAWNVTATIAKEYRVDGEKYTEPREGENIAYFLLHEVETKLEDDDYTARFYEDGANVLTDIQQNKFNIVTYDNGEVVEKVPYKRDLNLYVRANTLNDILVDSEEILKSNSGRLSMGTLRSDVKNSSIFTQTTYTRTDTYTEADGQVITLEELWQKEAWGSFEFPYASIASVSANTTTVRNANRCTNTREVYTVTTVFTVKVKYNGVNKADETYSIVVSYDRIYNIPDNIETKDENMQYVIVTKVSDSKDELIATEQFNAWNTNTYNRGVLQSSEAHRVDLPLSVKTTNGSSVSIKKEQRGQKVSVKAVDEGTASTRDAKVEGEDYIVRTTTRTATYTMSDGGKLPVTLVHGQGRKDGKNVLAYTEAKNLRVVSVETPVKNEALSSGENEVYDVKVNFAVDLEEKGSVQTRASGDVRTEYLVANYQQTIGDEYDPSKDRVVWTVTPNGNGFDIKGQKFETMTLTGEKEVSQVSGSRNFSVVGKNGSVKTVQNVNYQTNGNGWSGTGTTTYRDNASNGVSADGFQNEYDVTADGKLTLTLKGKNGQDVSKTFDPLLTLTEGGQNITTTGSTSTYTSNSYTNKVNAVYALEGKEVRASATASRELRVNKKDEYVPGKDRQEWIVTPNGNGYDIVGRLYETYTLSGERKVDEKTGSRNFSVVGKNGSVKTVQNVDKYQTSGNGWSGTGTMTYRDSADNGVADDGFQNEYEAYADGKLTLTLKGENGPGASKTFSPLLTLTEGGQNITTTGSTSTYTSNSYTNKVNGVYALEGKEVRASATASRELRVKKSNNLVRQWNEPSIRPNGQGFDVTVVFYEEYEQDGVITKTLTDKMGRGFDPQHTDDLTVSAFANPETTNNGATGGNRGTYSSTTRVGNGSRNNVRSYWYDETKTISYNGQSVTFRGSATFDEVSSTVGSPSVQGKNNVYPFTNKAQMVYTVRCDNKSESETITNEVKWNIIVPIPDNVPDLVPGKIKSAAITCVPANGDNASNYADGSNKRNAIKTICIVTDEGAVPVPFAAWDDDNTVVPTNAEISSGNFVNGNYSTAYNSGYYQSGKWVPAIAKDNSWGISYSIPTQENIRSIRNETLNQWNWRKGNYSVFVSGYNFDVDNNGVLTVYYNGEVVLQCK